MNELMWKLVRTSIDSDLILIFIASFNFFDLQQLSKRPLKYTQCQYTIISLLLLPYNHSPLTFAPLPLSSLNSLVSRYLLSKSKYLNSTL